jgi:hypothetical protein
MEYRVFPCPACQQIVDSTMERCKFCGVAIDPAAAAAAADTQEKVQKACGEASSTRITATAMPGFFLLSFVPVIGNVGLAGTAATLVIVPSMVIRWHRRFGKLKSPDPDLRRARQAIKVAALVWAGMLVVNVLWWILREAAGPRSRGY